MRIRKDKMRERERFYSDQEVTGVSAGTMAGKIRRQFRMTTTTTIDQEFAQTHERRIRSGSIAFFSAQIVKGRVSRNRLPG